MSYKSDIEIAREAKKQPIQQIGEKLGIVVVDFQKAFTEPGPLGGSAHVEAAVQQTVRLLHRASRPGHTPQRAARGAHRGGDVRRARGPTPKRLRILGRNM